MFDSEKNDFEGGGGGGGGGGGLEFRNFQIKPLVPRTLNLRDSTVYELGARKPVLGVSKPGHSQTSLLSYKD